MNQIICFVRDNCIYTQEQSTISYNVLLFVIWNLSASAAYVAKLMSNWRKKGDYRVTIKQGLQINRS
jgi:hypothetical protein